MIYVIDAMMGAGKTSAAINYMNSHKDRHYLYITPYLSETERIKKACPDLRFVLPSNQSKETGYRKSADMLNHIRKQKNIAMTHELYCRSDSDVVDAIAAGKYTVIIDEVIDVFEKPDFVAEDIDIAVKCGLLVPDQQHSVDGNICYTAGNVQYRGGIFRGLMQLGRMRRLVQCTQAKDDYRYVCWMLHRELFDASVDTYVMTYLFNGSLMDAFFKINKLSFVPMSVKHTDDGYQFDIHGEVPAYAKSIKDLLVICDREKLNRIGDGETALSKNWYSAHCYLTEKKAPRHPGGKRYRKTDAEKTGADWLRNNLNVFYKYYCDEPTNQRLWCAFKDYIGMIRGKGYYKCYIPWNTRATNDYSDKTALAYLVNTYINPSIKIFLESAGVKFDQDRYALSYLVQWIWRSAIRNGQKVYLYLPSSRMRRLLNEWMDSLVSGKTDELAS